MVEPQQTDGSRSTYGQRPGLRGRVLAVVASIVGFVAPVGCLVGFFFVPGFIARDPDSSLAQAVGTTGSIIVGLILLSMTAAFWKAASRALRAAFERDHPLARGLAEKANNADVGARLAVASTAPRAASGGTAGVDEHHPGPIVEEVRQKKGRRRAIKWIISVLVFLFGVTALILAASDGSGDVWGFVPGSFLLCFGGLMLVLAFVEDGLMRKAIGWRKERVAEVSAKHGAPEMDPLRKATSKLRPGSHVLLVIENTIWTPSEGSSRIGDLVFTDTSIDFIAYAAIGDPAPEPDYQQAADVALYGVLGSAVKAGIRSRSARIEGFQTALALAAKERLIQYGTARSPLVSLLCENSRVQYSGGSLTAAVDGIGVGAFSFPDPYSNFSEKAALVIETWPKATSCYDVAADPQGFYLPYIGPHELLEDPDGWRRRLPGEVFAQMATNEVYIRGVVGLLNVLINENRIGDLANELAALPRPFPDAIARALPDRVESRLSFGCLGMAVLSALVLVISVYCLPSWHDNTSNWGAVALGAFIAFLGSGSFALWGLSGLATKRRAVRALQNPPGRSVEHARRVGTGEEFPD
jgi:hypothetical protein